MIVYDSSSLIQAPKTKEFYLILRFLPMQAGEDFFRSLHLYKDLFEAAKPLSNLPGVSDNTPSASEHHLSYEHADSYKISIYTRILRTLPLY